MPCTFTGSLEGDEAFFAKEASGRYRRELDERERMLCALCQELERNFGEAATTSVLFNAEQNAKGIRGGQIQKWWSAHKAADAARSNRK